MAAVSVRESYEIAVRCDVEDGVERFFLHVDGAVIPLHEGSTINSRFDDDLGLVVTIDLPARYLSYCRKGDGHLNRRTIHDQHPDRKEITGGRFVDDRNEEGMVRPEGRSG